VFYLCFFTCLLILLVAVQVSTTRITFQKIDAFNVQPLVAKPYHWQDIVTKGDR